MTKIEATKETEEKVMEIIEIAKASGKIKRGTNEVTKSIERGVAKLVAIAGDVSPPEITMHIPLLCDEKAIPYIEVKTKEELGAAAGIEVGTVAVVVEDAGDAKNQLKEFAADSGKVKDDGKTNT